MYYVLYTLSLILRNCTITQQKNLQCKIREVRSFFFFLLFFLFIYDITFYLSLSLRIQCFFVVLIRCCGLYDPYLLHLHMFDFPFSTLFFLNSCSCLFKLNILLLLVYEIRKAKVFF